MFTTHPCLTICATTPDISSSSPVRDTFMVLARGLGNDSAHGHDGHVPKHTAATCGRHMNSAMTDKSVAGHVHVEHT